MSRRFGLPHLMVIVAFLAMGLAAMKFASEWVAKASMALGLVTLLVGTLGAIIRRRGAWIGFTLFGWAYAMIALITPINEELEARLPVSELMNSVADLMHPKPPGIKDERTIFGLTDYLRSDPHTDWVMAKIYCAEIGHVIAASIFASLGGIAGHFLDDQSKPAGKTPDGRMPVTSG